MRFVGPMAPWSHKEVYEKEKRNPCSDNDLGAIPPQARELCRPHVWRGIRRFARRVCEVHFYVQPRAVDLGLGGGKR